MASRKGRGAPESTEENTAVDETSTEAAPTEAPVETAPDLREEQLEAFRLALNEIVGEFDAESGTFTDGRRGEQGAISDEDMATLLAAYTEVRPNRKAANAAKELVMAGLTSGVNVAHSDAARAFLMVRGKLEEVTATRSAAPPKKVDPTETHVAAYAAAGLARQILFNTAPDGVAEDWAARADKLEDELQGDLSTYLAWFTGDPDERGDEPEVNAVIKAAVKIVQGKATGKGPRKPGGPRQSTFVGERGDILDHIRNAFEVGKDGNGVAVGERLSVAEIQSIPSKTYDGREPSAGAISSRLKGEKWDIEGTGIAPDDSVSPFGAKRVA